MTVASTCPLAVPVERPFALSCPGRVPRSRLPQGWLATTTVLTYQGGSS
jgi:hypothetical protein